MAHVQEGWGTEVGGALGSPLTSPSPSQKFRRAPSLPSILPKPARGTASRTVTETEKKLTGF